MLDSLLSFDGTYLLVALLGGILPALLWLGFWLREDAHPEPRKVVFRTFLAGACAALISIPLEALVYFSTSYKPILLVSVALIEEYAKYRAAKTAALNSSAYDEPVDALIYLITAALGFAALENVLFIAGAISGKGLVTAAIVGQTRFIGATLLHIVASASVGISLALPFFKDSRTKRRNFDLGLILAILLHAGFNFFIIQTGTYTLLSTFFSVWFLVVVLLLVFERIKKIQS